MQSFYRAAGAEACSPPSTSGSPQKSPTGVVWLRRGAVASPKAKLPQTRAWSNNVAKSRGERGSQAELSLMSVDNVAVTSAKIITQELTTEALEHRIEMCDSGLPDVEMCEITDPPPLYTPVSEAVSRGRWLMGLLIVQSTSSFILDSYSDLLKEHLVVTLFLTMLVGAGGNAGNQSAIKVIRGLATGSIKASWQSVKNTMQEQLVVGLLLGGGLSLGGFVRVYATNQSWEDAVAISLSLMMIVMCSVLLGTGLPFALTKVGVDPANAGTSIQVLMDILGVGITCIMCNLILVEYASMVAV